MPASRPTLNAPTFIVKTGKILNLTDSLRVQGEIEDVACQFVVDTGSNITIVRPDVVKDEILRNKISPVGSFLRTVTGESAPVIGCACMKFRLGGYETEQEVWLAEITDPCILGLDFLMAHDCQVDMAGAVLHIGKVDIPLVSARCGIQGRCCRVVASETVEIPARSDCLIFGSLDGHVSGTWGSVGPVKLKAGQTTSKGILVGRTLVDVRRSENLPVRVMNLSDERRFVKKGTEIADFEPIDCVVNQESRETSPVGTEGDMVLPNHLSDLYNRSKGNLRN